MASTVTETLPKPSTQSEARKAAQEYLKSRLTAGKAGGAASEDFTVPNIDINPSFSLNVEDRKLVAAQIRAACTNSGFFHITGHGIPENSRQAILKLSERFFKTLPREKKEQLHVKHSRYFRGWEPAEYTYVNPDDWEGEDAAPETKEGFNWGYEEGLDPTGGDELYTELDGSKVNGNVWPSEEDVPGFYETIKEYVRSSLF